MLDLTRDSRKRKVRIYKRNAALAQFVSHR